MIDIPRLTAANKLKHFHEERRLKKESYGLRQWHCSAENFAEIWNDTMPDKQCQYFGDQIGNHFIFIGLWQGQSLIPCILLARVSELSSIIILK